MLTKIVAIGNSKGIRIPKTVLQECGITGEVSLEVRGGNIVIAPVASPRAGWDEQFRRARSLDVKENLWGDVPLSEAWDK